MNEAKYQYATIQKFGVCKKQLVLYSPRLGMDGWMDGRSIYIIHGFTVTLDQFNASLVEKKYIISVFYLPQTFE